MKKIFFIAQAFILALVFFTIRLLKIKLTSEILLIIIFLFSIFIFSLYVLWTQYFSDTQKNKSVKIKNLFNSFISTCIVLIIVAAFFLIRTDSTLVLSYFSVELIIYAFVIASFAAITEEILFRGILFGACLKLPLLKLTIPLSLVLQAIAFAYWHASLNRSPLFYCTVFVYAIGIGIVTYQTKSLWYAIGIHCGWDFMMKIENGIHYHHLKNMGGIIDFTDSKLFLGELYLFLVIFFSGFYVFKYRYIFKIYPSSNMKRNYK